MVGFVIHIGPPKTASTYLQRRFEAMAPALRAAGVHYPLDLGRVGHEKLARALKQEGEDGALAPLFAGFAATGAGVVLLSAEDFANVQAPGVARLRALAGEAPVQVVYYCRRWSDLLRSRWGERVKHGMREGFGDYVAAALAAPEESSALNYARSVGRWMRAFGAGQMRLVAMEALAAAGEEVAAHFLRGFLQVDLAVPDVGGANRRLPIVETEILRALNAMDFARFGQRPQGLRQAFMRRVKSLELTATRAAVAADLVDVVVDETAPDLMRLHKMQWRRFGATVVAPRPAGQFFEPRRVVFRAARGGFVREAGVSAELEAAYAALLAAPVMQGRVGAA